MNRKCMKLRLEKKKYKTQKVNCCSVCFNTKSYLRLFGLCKKHSIIFIRFGFIPGFKKSSF